MRASKALAAFDLSVRQDTGFPAGCPWWTERASGGRRCPDDGEPNEVRRTSDDDRRESSGTSTTANGVSEARSEPRDRSRPRAFEALTLSQRSLVRSSHTHYLSDSRRATRVCYLFCDALEGRGAARRSPGAVDGVDLRPPTGLTANGYERSVPRPSARIRRTRAPTDVSEVLSMSDADLYVRGRQSDVWLGTESTNSRPKCGNSKRRSTG